MAASYINMDSEHSVFAAAMGAALAGERVFTATAGQGLFYSHEVLHAIAHLRLPIVICNVGRPSIPWNIWSDQSDSLSQRDTGWVQIYGESSQEVLDDIIQAYRITEQLNLPVMVVLDAFYQSHTSENIWIPEQKLVDDYLPAKEPRPDDIDLKQHRAYGGLVSHEHYDKFNFDYWSDINQVENLANQLGQEFKDVFGREYGTLEAVNINKDTKTILVTMSSISSTVRGVLPYFPDVGMLKIRLFKPFPKQSILNILEENHVVPGQCKLVSVDRNFMGDNGGALFQEMQRALFGTSHRLAGVYAGLGGRDVPHSTIEKIIANAKSTDDEITWIDI
jgi:pyruvate/2-oxoacid:ferredoxin oxidoreductase alpha subunit